MEYAVNAGPESLKPLGKQFRRNSFTFNEIERQGRLALYAKTQPPLDWTGYEVVIIERARGRTLPDGRQLIASETMPASTHWGVKGWTYTTLEDARKRYCQLAQDRPNLLLAWDSKPL